METKCVFSAVAVEYLIIYIHFEIYRF